MKQTILVSSRLFWVCLLMVGSASLALAQTAISGTLTDGDNGEPLIGANVLVVGTDVGTATDFDGKYELVVPAGASQLRISYAGYATQLISVEAGRSNYDLSMSAGELLDEVVVVGYGTQTQSEVTSAVVSVKEEDFNQGVVNNPTQLVQGKVAGLQIAQVGSDPNGSPAIRLRGLSTLGANTEPLIIIDGVIGATLNSVDPSDIASIDVLKDGSAAAIYGTRASSGVILVTTKKGESGKTQVRYNVQGGVESIANRIEVADAARFVELRGFNDDGSVKDNVNFGGDNDLVDLVSRTGLSQIHNLSFSGGLGTGSYRASFNYRDVQGVSNFSGFDQLNGRLNVQQSALDDKLRFDLTVSSTNRNAEFGFNEAFRYTTIFNPTLPINTPQSTGAINVGGFNQIQGFDYFNPVAINEQASNTGKEGDLLLAGRVSFEPIDGLIFSGLISRNKENDTFERYYQKDSYFVGLGRNGLADLRYEEKRNDLFELTGTYSIPVGSNTIDFLAGYSYQQLEEDFSQLVGGNFISDVVNINNFSQSADFANGLGSATSGGDRSELESYFARASVDIDNTYFFQASVRSDGSTRFGRDEKRGIFPAVSAGVDLSKFVSAESVDRLKLRAGYGITGNLPGQSLLSQTTYVPQSNFFFDGGFTPAYGPGRNSNPTLRFEKKAEFNAGLDFAFMDYKLTGSIDYFRRRTTDLLYEITVPTGAPNPTGGSYLTSVITANLEDVAFQNTGVELSLGYEIGNSSGFRYNPRVVLSTVRTVLDTVDVVDPDFTYFSNGNSFFNDNSSPGAPGQNGNPTIIVRAGEEIGQIYGPVFAGISEDGGYVYEDLNGDGSFETGAREQADKQVLGSGLPDFTLGLANDFRFGDFDASLFFRGAFGHSLVNMNRLFYENVSPSRGTDNVVTTELFDPALRPASPEFNSLYVEKASFVTLDNASIGYNVPLASDAKIAALRVGLAGQRLFYITNYTGVDPEVRYSDQGAADNGGRPSQEFNPDPLSPGLDRRYNYFRTRSFNLQLSVTF